VGQQDSSHSYYSSQVKVETVQKQSDHHLWMPPYTANISTHTAKEQVGRSNWLSNMTEIFNKVWQETQKLIELDSRQ